MTNRIKLPSVRIPESSKAKTLPFNGNAVTEKSFSISFACFDRTHELFNLGGTADDNTVGGKWFLDLLDCLKNICNMNISDIRGSMYDIHPIEWNKTNAAAPKGYEQIEYWQFRINKSRGRVIGFKIDGVFYVVWLDPHHNLTDSEGYGTVQKYRCPESEYDSLLRRIAELEENNQRIKEDLETANQLLEEYGG